MNILICAGIFPPEVGGPATYAKQLVEELVSRGHNVRVVTYGDGKTRLANPKIFINVIRRGYIKPWHYYKYYRAVKKYGAWADLIYAQGPVSDGYPAMLAAKKSKKPFMVKITGDYSWEQARNRGLSDLSIDEFQRALSYEGVIGKIREIQFQVCAYADLVITPSEYLRKLVEAWGVDGEKIKVIYNGMRTFEVDLSKKLIRAREGFADRDFVVFSAGRAVPWKGFETLKQAVRELSDQEKLPITLMILNNAKREQVLEMMRAADVFVLNTAYEGFPHIVLEAMSLGTPVVTTNVCGNPELVENGTDGLLVEYDDKAQLKSAIRKVFQDADLRSSLIVSAQKKAKQFGFEKMIEKTEKSMLQLIRKN